MNGNLHLNHEQGRKQRFFLQAYIQSLSALLPLLLVYIYFNSISPGSHTLNNLNTLGPIYFTLVLLNLVYQVGRKCPDAIWTPAFWLPFQSAVFFGFGPLVQIFGNAPTQYRLENYVLAVSPEELFRTNLLSATGVWFLLMGLTIHLFKWQRGWRDLIKQNRVAQRPVVSPVTLVTVFLLLGGIVKYVLIMPAAWGLVGIVMPGTVTTVMAVVDVGFGIAAYLAARGHRTMRLVLYIGLPMHFFLCYLSFSKSQIIIALLLPALGAFIAHQKYRRLLVWILVMTLVYMTSQPIVSHGRAQIYAETGTIADAGYVKRARFLFDYFTLQKTSLSGGQLENDEQAWWTRLNYAGPQAYAMNAYDSGLSGSTLKSLWLYLIPRFIWPSKPLLFGPGLEYYRLVTGNVEGKTFLGLSIYGDLYWQFGWHGVVWGSVLIGFLFAFLSKRSLSAVKNRDFIQIPIVLIVLNMAIFGPTGFVTNGIIGPLPIYVGYLLLVGSIIKVLRPLRIAKRFNKASSGL